MVAIIIVHKLFALCLFLYFQQNHSYIQVYGSKRAMTMSKQFLVEDTASTAVDIIRDFPISTAIATSVGVFGLWKFFNYWKIQYVIAKTVSGIPKRSKVVELDVQNGKNVFYLSEECEYTAIMSVTEVDISKKKEKTSFNERMILESVGKANV